MIEQITDHEQRADNRFITQYKESDIKKVTKIYSKQIQELEDVFFQLLNERSLTGSIGVQLDNFGTIVDQARLSLPDSTYRALITVKIAEINSQATIEDLIQIFSIFMNADEIIFGDIYPSSFQLTAVNPSPIADLSLLSQAITRAKSPGVGFQLVSTPLGYMGFVGDTDGLGFGTATDPLVGGFLSELI